MGKVDDMRKLREAQFAQRERAAGGTSKKAAEEPASEEPVEDAGASHAADAEGTCAACGKVKPLHNGLVAVHQKGLGKVCAGSRKAPR